MLRSRIVLDNDTVLPSTNCLKPHKKLNFAIFKAEMKSATWGTLFNDLPKQTDCGAFTNIVV